MNAPRSLPLSQTPDFPTFKISSEGSAVSDSFEIVSITVTHEANRVSFAEILIFDGDPTQSDFPASAANDFAPNKKIKIELGYHTQNKVVFEGLVIRQRLMLDSGKSVLKVECKDKAYLLTLGRNNAYFYDQKDSAIISSLIQGKGLSASVDSTRVTHKEMVQYGATDWDFILSRAEANGMLVYTEKGKVSIKKPEFNSSPALQLLHGATILELDAELDATTQVGSVDAFAWDPANQKLEQQSSSNPGVVSPGNMSSSSLADNGGLKKLEVHHAGQLKGEELSAWASAELLRSQMAKVRGRVRIQGFTDIVPGKMIDLQGLGTRFSGKAFVSGVRHELNNQNFETDLTFGLDPDSFSRKFDNIRPVPAEGLVPAMNGLHIAVVTKLEADPEGEFRIRVRIPLLDKQGEGSWARVATLDAGNKRGTMFLPEIGDEVIVGFLDDDPRNPIVLGQLHSSKNAAPLIVKDENHQKGYVSRSEMKMIFDDEKKSFTLETPKGKKFILDDDAGEIKLMDETGNKIVMDSNGITIESAKKITIKATQDASLEGMNVNIKASAQLKAEGSAGAELSASGQTVIKGAVVQIN